MNYPECYEKLIEKRKKERPEGYTENHHVIPTCMGGPNIPENLVRLAAKEHLIAHLLLVKMNPGHFGLIHSAFSMSNNKKYGSRKYAWVKEKYSESIKGVPKSEETREKMRKPKTEVTREKMRKPKSAEHCKNISIAQSGKNNSSAKAYRKRQLKQKISTVMTWSW